MKPVKTLSLALAAGALLFGLATAATASADSYGRYPSYGYGQGGYGQGYAQGGYARGQQQYYGNRYGRGTRHGGWQRRFNTNRGWNDRRQYDGGGQNWNRGGWNGRGRSYGDRSNRVTIQPYPYPRGGYGRQDFGSTSPYEVTPRVYPYQGPDVRRRDRRELGDFSPLAPYAGAGAAGAATYFGAPPEVAAWYGDRVNANTRGAGREYSLGDAGVRIVTGVSPRDIQERGILGGDNSEARKFCNALFGSC